MERFEINIINIACIFVFSNDVEKRCYESSEYTCEKYIYALVPKFGQLFQ